MTSLIAPGRGRSFLVSQWIPWAKDVPSSRPLFLQWSRPPFTAEVVFLTQAFPSRRVQVYFFRRSFSSDDLFVNVFSYSTGSTFGALPFFFSTSRLITRSLSAGSIPDSPFSAWTLSSLVSKCRWIFRLFTVGQKKRWLSLAFGTSF